MDENQLNNNLLRRDVFLDNDHESTHLQYRIWLQKAQDQGHAIAIGHSHPTTIEYLGEHMPEVSNQYRFPSVSKLSQ